MSWQAALLNAVAVLIITCPCALGLAVPVLQVIASGRLMRRGILLKSATALEQLAAVDTVVFDKTGTMTLGRLELVDKTAIAPLDLRLAASLAAASRHQRAGPGAPALAAVVEHPGRGLSAMLPAGEVRLRSRAFCRMEAGPDDAQSELWLKEAGRPPIRFAFHDALRPDAAQTVAALQRAGHRVLLVSGDRPAAVAETARALGIAEWQAATTPQGKCATLAALARAGRRVLMVGDGLKHARSPQRMSRCRRRARPMSVRPPRTSSSRASRSPP